ncbi:hypothetical protein ACWCP6_10025 [Streptomyces sp. NPDC002004]
MKESLVKKALLLAPALLLLAACGSDTGAVKNSRPADPASTAPPIERQQRSLACGTTIAPPLAPSGDKDPVRLALTSATARTATGIAVSYRITGSEPTTMLSLPIGEVPPTALLLKGDAIVATQTPAQPSIDGSPALGYPVGKKPYVKTLRVDLPCRGTTFKDVTEHPDRYRVIVVMSVQNAGMPKDTRTPLVDASAVPRVAG